MQHAPSTDPEEHRELERSRLQESLAATPARYVRPRAVVSAAWLSGAAVDGSIIDESGALAIDPVDTNIIYVGTSKQYQHLLQLPTRPGTNASVQHAARTAATAVVRSATASTAHRAVHVATTMTMTMT
jgi:hypothetical protein